jgi:hypothetical protein
VELKWLRTTKQKTMIKHLLLLQFKENIDQKQINSMFIQFIGLKSTIDGINSIEYGTNKNPEKLNKNFTHAVEVTFTCLEARDRYLIHHDHKDLQTVLLDLLSDLIVFDLEC